MPDSATFSMSSQPSPHSAVDLLSLPAELRVEIWKYSLQISPVEAASALTDNIHMSPDMVLRLNASSYFFDGGPRHPPYLLRVCKLIHQEATPIFYSNTVVLQLPTGRRRTAENRRNYRQLMDQISCPRPLNPRNLVVVVHAWPVLSAFGDSAVIANAADVFTRAWGVLDMVHVHVVEGSTVRRRPGYMVDLMRGLGLLQCHKPSFSGIVKAHADGLEWAMRQPGRTMPLSYVSSKAQWFLMRFKWDPSLHDSLLEQLNEAAEQLDADRFSNAMERVLNAVEPKLAEMTGESRRGAVTEMEKLRALHGGDFWTVRAIISG